MHHARRIIYFSLQGQGLALHALLIALFVAITVPVTNIFLMRAERRFGWRAATDFGSVLAALRDGTPLPFAHDPDYTSPIIAQEREACMC